MNSQKHPDPTLKPTAGGANRSTEEAQRADYVTREAIVKLLTDRETAEVSIAESAPQLAPGDEYIDLEHLEQKVQRAGAAPIKVGRVVTRKAVPESTWKAILATMAGFPTEAEADAKATSQDEITLPPTPAKAPPVLH